MTVLSDQYASMDVQTREGTGYRLSNNAWNYQAYTGQQVIENNDGRPSFRIAKGGVTSGQDVISYPSLWRGCGLFSTFKTAQSFMPCELAVSSPILSSLHTTQNTAESSKWNTTYDIWVASAWPGGQYRTAEIMIMLTYPFLPPGTVKTTIDGMAWHVTQKQVTRPDVASWQMIQFRAASQRTSVSDLDLTGFFRYVVAHGWAKTTDLLIQISAGFELWTGGDGLSVDRFSIQQW